MILYNNVILIQKKDIITLKKYLFCINITLNTVYEFDATHVITVTHELSMMTVARMIRPSIHKFVLAHGLHILQ